MEEYLELLLGEHGVHITKVNNIDQYLEKLPQRMEDYNNELEYLHRFPNDLNADYECNDSPKVILFKGNIIVPKGVEVAKRFTLD